MSAHISGVDPGSQGAPALGERNTRASRAQEALYLYEQLHRSAAVPAEYQIEESRGDVIRFLQRKQ